MRLTFESGPLAGHAVELPPGATLLGRADYCDVVLDDPTVSGEHAELFVDHGQVSVRDLESRNGTLVDGAAVEGDQPLGDGSRLQFGRVAATLRMRSSRGQTSDFAPVARSRLPLVLAGLAVLLAGAALALAVTGRGGGDGAGGGPVPTPTAVAGVAEATATPTPTPEPFTRRDAIRLARRGTVGVLVDGEQPAGTGWVVDADAGLVVTNAHVVAGATEFAAAREGERPRPAELVAINQCEDLALLRLEDADGLRALRLGRRPALGEDVLMVGFPDSVADEDGLQIKTGTIADRRTTLAREDRELDAAYTDLVQIDGTLIGGNSGGPLIAQDDGRVVGVNSLVSGANETESYAIAPERVGRVLPYLRDGTSVPGMTLEFFEDGSPPRVIGVSSPTLIDAGVVPGGEQELATVNGRRFGVDLPASLAALCRELPRIGDGRETRVTWRFRDPDGTTFPVTLGY